MFELFLFCSVAGGTLLVIQTAMTAFGLADGDLELADDVGIEFDADLDGLDADFDADFETGESGEAGSLEDDLSSAQSNWLFSVLSFRTLVAATTFFGLSGTASTQAGLSQLVTLVIAVACGLAAMLTIHFLMRTLYRLGHDGTVRVADAIGRQGTVYLPVPANREGSGRVQIRMDDRIMEFEALCSHEQRLKTGTTITVVGVLGPSLVEVEPEDSSWKRDPLYRASQIAISEKQVDAN